MFLRTHTIPKNGRDGSLHFYLGSMLSQVVRYVIPCVLKLNPTFLKSCFLYIYNPCIFNVLYSNYQSIVSQLSLSHNALNWLGLSISRLVVTDLNDNLLPFVVVVINIPSLLHANYHHSPISIHPFWGHPLS